MNMPVSSGRPNSNSRGGSQKARVTVKLVVLFAIYAYCHAKAASSPPERNYNMQGILEVQSIRFANETKSYYYDYFTNGFEVSVSDCRWWMKLGTRDPKVYDYRIVSSDGTNTYLLLAYETRQRLANSRGQQINNIGDGTVTSGTLPCFDFAREAGAVWIAYASACNFAKATKGRQPVPFSSYIRPKGIMPGDNLAVEDVNFVSSEAPPYLPIELNYYLEDLKAEGFSVANELKESFTNVIFKRVSVTNCEGFTFSKEASVAIYRPNPQQQPKVVPQLCEVFRMITTNITFDNKMASFKPQLPGKTIVAEQRFNNGTGLSLAYFITNDWPSTDIVKELRAYREAKAVVSVKEKESPLRRQIVMLILVVFSILPVIVWFYKRSHGQ